MKFIELKGGGLVNLEYVTDVEAEEHNTHIHTGETVAKARIHLTNGMSYTIHAEEYRNLRRIITNIS